MEYMSAEERKVFYFDVRTIDWKSYFDTYILGARKFILKDDISSLTVARKNLTRYSQLHSASFGFANDWSVFQVVLDSNAVQGLLVLLLDSCNDFNEKSAQLLCLSQEAFTLETTLSLLKGFTSILRKLG